MYQQIIDRFYSENTALRRILLDHSKAVADKAIAIAKARPDLCVDEQFVYEAAMLHDIGIILCDAPGIECYGTEPYIRHGMLGARMLREYAAENGIPANQIEPYARVCERHTGAGLTACEIRKQQLPLPEVDMLPETLEERLICYADKFFSKTRPSAEKPMDRVEVSMRKFGEDTLRRFNELKTLFQK